MIPIKILDETAPLEAVVLGTAESNGSTPGIQETYDPKSREQVLAGTYPKEKELILEIDSVQQALEKHGVTVYRPEVIYDYNQVFARDVAFCLEDTLFVPQITEGRQREFQGIQHLLGQVEKVVYPGEDLQMEGGDIIPWNGNLFLGYSEAEDFNTYTVARTSKAALDYLIKSFPQWKVKGFELVKSDVDPLENVLHLDCCFQPIGNDKAVMYPGGFKHESDVKFLFEFFGEENIFEVHQEEAYDMYANLFSINPRTILSDSSFFRLNGQLRDWGFTVEEVKYREVPRMGGSFRCSTLPLRRRYE